MKSEPMPSQQASPGTRYPVLCLAIGFVLGSIVVGLIGLRGQPATPTANVIHNVTVSYMYETQPGTATGSNDTPVESIEFHPGYVIIQRPSGRRSLFAVNRLRRFHFEPAASDSAPKQN